jgi:P27 family predicted phage terminase small subunit
MPMGRPPKPVEQKRLAGNPGKRPLPEPVVVIPSAELAVPAYPRGLRKVGKEAWDRLWRVGGAWLSPATDWDIMVRLCQAHDEREELRRAVRKHGHSATGGNGQEVAHPAVLQLRTLEGLITRWESLCGFTPSDRSRLGLVEVQRLSKLDEFLQRQATVRGHP